VRACKSEGHAMSGMRRQTQTRRSAFLGVGAAIAMTAAGAIAAPARSDVRLEAEPPLRSRSRAPGIKYGCAGAAPNLQPDAMMLSKMAAEANVFVPEGCLKWLDTEMRPGEFDFAAADSMAAFAARNDMMIHGHTLVWYAELPDWVMQLATAPDAEAAL